MALERIGIGAVFGFNEKPGVAGMKKSRDASGRLRNELGQFMTTAQKLEARFGRLGRVMGLFVERAKRVGAAVRKMGRGLRDLGMGLSPLSLGMGIGIKKAADFEHQMAAAGAVIRDATAPNLKLLADKAEELGIKSAFSQAKVGEAMELMGIAGANTQQVMAGIKGVTDLAAGGALDVASASDAVAQGVKIMRLEWEDATKVADVYAMASVSANTTVLELAEAMKMGGQKARSMGIGLEETVTVLSRLADAGLKGTMGGTAFTNMLVKLSKPGAEARKLMKKWNIELTNSDGKLKKISEIVDQFREKLQQVPDVAERARMASEIFGIRGERAYNALFAAGSKSLQDLERSLEGSFGKATEMAEKRLDSLKGKLTLLGSSLEGFATKLFQSTLGDFQDDIASFTGGLNNVLMIIKEFEKGYDEASAAQNIFKKEGIEVSNEQLKIASGISEAIAFIKDSYKKLSNTIKELGKKIKDVFGADAVEKISKWGVLIAVAGAAIAPIILGFVGLSFVISGVISVVGGLASVISAAFVPVLIIGGGLLLLFSLLRKENESLGETVARVWGGIKQFMLDVYENALKPFWQGIQDSLIPALKGLGEAWNHIIVQIKELWSGFADSFQTDANTTQATWATVGGAIGNIIKAVAHTIMFLVETVIRALDVLLFPLKAILQVVHNVAAAFGTMFGGNILEGLGRLGLAILDGLLTPIRSVVKTVIELAELVGAGDLIPSGVKTFAEDGITELVYGDKARTSRLAYQKEKIRKEKEFKVPALLKEPPIDKGFFKQTAGSTAEGEKFDRMANMIGDKVKTAVETGIKDKKTVLDIKNQMCVDGESLNVASSRHRTEVEERSGAKHTPWQRRTMMEHGAVSVPRTA